MKKIISTLSLILICGSSFSQRVKQQDNFAFAMRGKLFGFFIIEDIFFSTGTVGFEVSHKSGHSIGADLTFFHWRYEHDNMDDDPLTETYEKRTYAYLDYKYRFAQLKEFDLYFNVYDKIGAYRYWREGVAEGYNDITMPELTDKTKGTFNQVGIGVGIKKFYTERSYIDISMNGGKTFKNDHAVVYDEGVKTSVEQFNAKSSNPVFYIRISFGIILKGEFAKKPALKVD
jgi:hypothetical protein